MSGNGDSGGPAFVPQAGGGPLLLGVSSRTDSWFHAVGEYGVKERYTRVSAYQDWMRTVMTGRLKLTGRGSGGLRPGDPEPGGRCSRARGATAADA